MFYHEILIILIEGYVEFCMTYYLVIDDEVRNPEIFKPYNDGYEFLSDVMTYLIFLAAFVILPYLLFSLIFYPVETIRSQSFRDNWEALYKDLRTREKPQIMFYMIFIIRRAIFVAIGFKLKDRNFYQLITLNFMNLFMLVYQGNYRPMDSYKLNFIELVNEVSVCCACINMMLFSELVLINDDKYKCGWILVIIILLQILFNLIYIALSILNSIKLLLTKIYNIIVYYCTPRIEPEIEPEIQENEPMFVYVPEVDDREPYGRIFEAV